MEPFRDQPLASSSDDTASLAGLPYLPRNAEFDAMFGNDAAESSDPIDNLKDLQSDEPIDSSETPDGHHFVWADLPDHTATHFTGSVIKQTQPERPSSFPRGTPDFQVDPTSISNYDPWEYSPSNNYALTEDSLIMPGQYTQATLWLNTPPDWDADVPADWHPQVG